MLDLYQHKKSSFFIVIIIHLNYRYIPWNLHEPQRGKFSSTYAKQLE